MSSFFFEKLGSPLNALILKDIINLFLMAEFQFGTYQGFIMNSIWGVFFSIFVPTEDEQ
jgi:hypothetical protein